MKSRLYHSGCFGQEVWINDRGEYCLASARKALPVLAARLGLLLPAPRAAFGRERCAGQPMEIYPDLSLRCRLADIGSVTLELVDGDADRRLWEAMMATHHPQGWARAPGGQLRYWVCSSHGRLGGIGFSAASWHQKARDDFIGWSADARAANLSLVINNHRFLLLPGVRVHGLASQVLAVALERVAADWHAAYKVRPVMAYSYVGPEHAGTCYREAGWQCCLRRTSGRPPGSTGGAVVRTVWMKPLATDWGALLCAEPARDIRAAPALHMDEHTDWAEREYARSTHPDGRIRDRIVRIGRAWLDRPGAAIPAIFPSRKERKAAYRLLSNGSVTMDHIVEPHQATMVERCQLEEVVLAIQDTTTLNYDGLEATGGLVGVGGGGKGTRGLLAHVGLAVNSAGRPLGVFALDATFRDGDDKESLRWEREHERAQELARACPATRVVTVCDREGDIWALLATAASQGAGLVVRASHAAQRRVVLETGEEQDLWEHVAALPRLAGKTVEIVACGGKRTRPGRKAKLDLRAARVRLAPPRKSRSRETVNMLAVSATEPDPPAGKEPLNWLLLTTEDRADTETAQTVVTWYERRWTIEEYFKVLKTGARIKDRRLDHADDLRKCLAFDAVTACHVFDLERRARDKPDTPADQVVTDDEIVILYVRLMAYGIIRAPPPPGKPPDIRTLVIDISRLAGFHPRKTQPLPGTQLLWKGYVYLRDATHTYRALKELNMIKN